MVTGTLLVMYRIEDVDLSQAWFYTAHTFLDSTPDSWLSPECRADPTENCREADGLAYFGPANLRAGVMPLALNHPWTTVAKSVRSALGQRLDPGRPEPVDLSRASCRSWCCVLALLPAVARRLP